MVHVNPSTVVELAGFTFLGIASWRLGVMPGLVVTGVLLLFIGYLIEDDKAGVALRRPFAILAARRAARKARKTNA